MRKKSILIMLFLLLITTICCVDRISVDAASKGNVYLKKNSGTIFSGDTIKITVKKKKNVYITKKTFKSNNKKIATVTSKGNIKGVKEGKAVVNVKVTYKLGKKNKKYTKNLKYTIKVKKKNKSASDTTENTSESDNKQNNTNSSTNDGTTTAEQPAVTPATITFGKDLYTVKEGETIKVDVMASPGAVLEWSLSDAVNRIDQEGNLTGCGALSTVTKYIIVKDTVSGVTAKCPYKVEVGNYESPYSYKVAIMGTPMLGGASCFNNHIYLYINTNNPGDRYFEFDILIDGISTGDMENNMFKYTNNNFVDLNTVNVSTGDVFHYCSKIDNEGYLVEAWFRPKGDTANRNGGWNIIDYDDTYRIMKNSGGKAKLVLYEDNPNLGSSTNISNSAKRDIVWQKEITLNNFYEELDKWIDNTFVPMVKADVGIDVWNNYSDYEKMSAMCDYWRNVYARYGLHDYSTGVCIPTDSFAEIVGTMWEAANCNYSDKSKIRFTSPRADSQSSPVLLKYITERVLGCKCVVAANVSQEINKGKQGVAIVTDSGYTDFVRADPDSNQFLSSYTIPVHDINYFLELYNAPLMASDPITEE